MKKFLLLLIPLLFTGLLARAELVDSTLYNFRDGTIYNNGASADGSLVLLNTGTTVKYKNSSYGLDVKLDGEIKLAVNGSCTVRFLGSAYSSLNMTGVSKTGGINLGKQDTKVAHDLSDTYDFVYDGPADTLLFTATGSGSDIYLPQMEVIPEQPGADSLFTSALKNVEFYYDFRDGSIIPNSTSFNGNYVIDTGLIKIDPGSSNAYGYKGSQHGAIFKTGNTVTLKVGGNSYIKVGGSIYSSGTISAFSSTGSFNVTSQDAKTSGNYGSNGSTVDFLYVGSAGSVTLAFTSTVYDPIIKVVPYPYDITLESYTQKSGAIMFNGDTINVTSGATSSSLPTVTVSGNGTVISATKEMASVRTDLSGNSLSSYTPAVSGNISSVNISGDTLLVAYADSSSMPYGYKILVTDNSQTVTAQAGKTYSYNLADGSVLPQNSSIEYSTFVTKDGIVTMNSGTGKQFAYHDGTHGTVFSNGNSIDFVVAGDAKITLTTCKYSATDSWMVFRNAQGDSLGAIRADNSGGTDGFPISFSYTGGAGVITGTLVTSGSVYLHAVSIANAYVKAEAGKTYSYNLADGSVLPQNSTLKYSDFMTKDGIVSMKSGTGKQFSYHDATHGTVFSNGNSMDFVVAGNATITLTTCTYSAADSWMVFRNAQGDSLGAIRADNNGGTDGYASNFSYTGGAGVITGTLVTSGSVYLHALSIQNAAAPEPSNGKIDVWDFGAVQLNTADYNNELNDTVINSWYNSSITPGSNGNVLPSSFTAGALSWVGGSNDRLRTTNTKLTRYDENISGATNYTGRIYVNATAATGRYMSLTLNADDIVTVEALSQNGTGRLNFQYVPDPSYQTDQKMLGSDVAEYKFVAKKAGTYHIFDDKDKPSYYRIYREPATYVTIKGTVDVSQAAGIPSGYGINLENKAGKVWNTVVSGGAYSVKVPASYTYSLSLSGANGYVISNGESLDVTDTTSIYNVAVKQVELYTVSGLITGLKSANLSNLSLKFVPDPTANKVYVPDPVIDANAATYTVQLEPACNYTIQAQGVNDYYIPDSVISIGHSNTTKTIAFKAKTVYHVKLNVSGLTTDEEKHLKSTFTNLNESGYVYSFDSIDSVNLRNGTYKIGYSGLDAYPVKLRLTSYLKIDGDTTSKALVFNPVNDWTFDDKPITGSSYEGLLFTGSVSSEVAKGHLMAKPGSTIEIPVKPGDKIGVTYYYTADFTIGGTEYTTSSQSTSKLEYAEYTYPGDTTGHVTITIGSSASTTYIPDIDIGGIIPYQPVIYVGADKKYKTINEALDAIAKMNRTSDQRVTVMIDPGNYEEMLVINVPNVTLKNAADKPTTGLTDEGVDITPGAVRVTSYYGDGYNYYSMGANQKWNADILRVDKENGSLSNTNTGAGTTNGSYWNATVVVNAAGFHADNIIFENSFNQYISKKESEDVVVPWTTGSPGVRPTDYGDVSVQNRSLVERACALAFTSSGDKAVLKKCRIVGRQDALYGGSGVRVVFNRCIVMGAVDYTFGAMTAVFYKTDMVMNTSDASNDASYLTAAQQTTGRGYLMYKCEVKSPIPGIETASTYYSKPGYFGRPWQANTSEVVFYKTTVDTSGYPGFVGKSLITPIGWNNTLGGESSKMYEYGTTELSGVDNSSNRASWSTVLTKPVLTDGTDITTYNFTKGTDDWDPLPVETDALTLSTSKLGMKAAGDSATFDIKSNVEWTVSSSQSWLKVKGVGYGVDTANIVVIAAQNTTATSRTATVTIYGDNVGTQVITVTQEASTTTGINDIPKNSFTIYPNPARSSIVVKRQKAGPGRLIIMNSLGQIVYQQPLESESERISLPSVRPGLYIVAVDGQKQKLIINR